MTILHLFGSPYERGLAHGRLMKKEILSTSIAFYYGDFLKILLTSALGEHLAHWLDRMLQALWYNPLAQRISEETKQEIKGLADSTGLDKELITRAFLAPDIMQLLISGILRGGHEGKFNYYIGGCSASYGSGDALRHGYDSLLARNLDFPGALIWKYPIMVYHHPTEKISVPQKDEEGCWTVVEKQKQPYVYFSTAGYPGTGLTGFNASGISMSTFVCLSTESSRFQMPSLDFNHRLFTALEQLDDLPQILDFIGTKSAVPHVVLFADKKRALTVECSSKRSVVHQPDLNNATLVQTNHFFSPTMKKNEIHFPMERESSLTRYHFLQDSLDKHFGKLDPKKMIDMISSSYNPYGGRDFLSGVPTPAQSDTLQSLVFDLGKGHVWMAEGNPPGICLNRYRGFDMYDGFSLKKRNLEPSDFKPRQWSPEQRERKSLIYYSLAWEQMKKGHWDRSVKLLEKALDLYKDPGYELNLAVLALHCGELDKALSLFRHLEDLQKMTPLKDSVLPLWIGRTLDLMGKRSEALDYYEKGMKSGGLIKEYTRAYVKGLRKPFTRKNRPFTMNFKNPDPVSL